MGNNATRLPPLSVRKRRVQPVPLESAHQKVAVVYQEIPHTGIRQVGGQIGLPHPLGEPQAGRLDAEAAPDRLPHPGDLVERSGRVSDASTGS